MRDLKFNEIDAVSGGRSGAFIQPLPPVYISPDADIVKPYKPFDPGYVISPGDPVEPGGYITPIRPPEV